MLAIVSVLAVAVVGIVAAVLVAGVGGAARRAGLSHAEAGRVVLRAGLLVVGWLGVAAAASASGVLADFEARPPRMVVLLVASLVVFAGATRTATFGRLLAAAPVWWPIAIQSMRVPIELGLWGLFLEGKMPVHMTFEGRNFDVLVGITAPAVAFAAARGWIGARGLVGWNIASLALLANVVVMGVTTMPGPLHLPWPGPSERHPDGAPVRVAPGVPRPGRPVRPRGVAPAALRDARRARGGGDLLELGAPARRGSLRARGRAMEATP